MAKYEIMLLVSGKLSTAEADKVNQTLIKNIKVDKVDTKFLGTKELAYPINNETLAHYYLLTFDGAADSFVDWRRLALINKSVLRHLIVNLEKDYGWRSINNEKKVKLAAGRKAKYEEIMNNPDYVPTRTSHGPHYRSKKRDEWTIISRIGPNGPEDISDVKNRTNKRSRHSGNKNADGSASQAEQIAKPVEVKDEPKVEVQPEPKVEAKPKEVAVEKPAEPQVKEADDKSVKLKPVSAKKTTAKKTTTRTTKAKSKE